MIFFDQRKDTLNVIGSSAGAFRAACFAQSDPIAAVSRLADCYSHTVYSNKPSPDEISTKAAELLNYVYGNNGCAEILENEVIKAHFIVAKTKGLVTSEQKVLQLLGLFSSYALNKINRKYLKYQYQRIVYHTPHSRVQISDQYQFNTQYIPLTPTNIQDALLASGSIPLVMNGIKNIAGSPKGMYRDGGIIDYNFDLDIKISPNKNKANNDNLILYPHFNASPKPGWFDKELNCTVLTSHYDNVVMLVPSQKFINSLPYQKIPDRGFVPIPSK